jgi:hypothetical protein
MAIVGNHVRDIPGQQFFEARDGMVGDAIEDVSQISLRIEAVQLRRSD